MNEFADTKSMEGKVEEVDKSPGKICEGFLQETGMHGVNKLKKSSRNCWQRVIWGFAILGCGVYLLITVTKEIQKFLTYPKTTSIDVEFVQKLAFPAVTVCNLSPYNRSKMNLDEKLLNYDVSMNAFWSFGTKINWTDPYYKENNFFEPMSRDYLMNNISMEFEKMFTGCYFDSFPQECKKMFKQKYTHVGPCYTFNDDGSVKTSRKGTTYNLNLEIFIDQSNYYHSFHIGSGFQVVVHEPGEFVDIHKEGLVVPPGTVAYISVDKHRYEFLPSPYKALSDGYCLDLEEAIRRDPKKYTNYTQSGCQEQCFQTIAEFWLNCTPIIFSDPKKPYCSQYQLKTQIGRFASLYVMDEDVEEECKLQCPVKCKYNNYVTQISYGQYPSDFINEELQRYLKWNKSLEYVRNNYLNVRVYYDRLATTITRQVPVYSSWEQILANLGGQMGLFLGASIITLTELLEFVVNLSLHFAKKTSFIRSEKSLKNGNKL